MGTPEQNAVPLNTAWMDSAMTELWVKLGTMPERLRLYGGAAFALYLGHRVSKDLDWATDTGVVDTEVVQALLDERSLEGEIAGGPGMADCTVVGNRNIKMSFMECGYLIPNPTQAPVHGPMGTLVASPVDLVASKLKCIRTRSAERDYVDLAEAEKAWPGIIARARKTLGESNTRGWKDHVLEPPEEIAQALSEEQRSTLQRAARTNPRRKTRERT